MGLSITVAGSIMLMVFLIVSAMLIQFSLNSSAELSRASDEQANTNNQIAKTSIVINSIQRISNTSSFVNVTITNTGTTKLYNYKYFDVFVTYESAIKVGPLTLPGPKVTEHLKYAGISVTALPGQWAISQFKNDTMDPQIINYGEGAILSCNLSSLIYSGGPIYVAVSTDKGVVATKSGVL